MEALSTKTTARASLVLLGALLVGAASLAVGQTHQSADKQVYVNLQSLPDQFNNDKLPAENCAKSSSVPANGSRDERCYNMIGCFERIPITTLPQDPQDLKTQFRLYNNQGASAVVDVGRYEVCLESKPTECDRYPFDLQQLIDSPFSPRRRTIVVIGGYFSKAPSNWELRVKDLWSRLDDVNVIIVGWVGGNSGLYTAASVNTRPVARQLTVLLYYLGQLHNLDLSDEAFVEKFYLVGHSLGAHIAGFVGQDLAGRVGRITGLDPAGPQFDKLPNEFRLDKGDAQLVDVMHTNSGSKVLTLSTRYGSSLASGHVDLYANNGQHQPACSNDLLGCSHKKANAYYEAFLNHAISMREYLKCNNCLAYRLRAYYGDSYDEFHNGSSLKRRCPISVLDEEDLASPDLDSCSIPVDYVSWFDVVRDELQSKHGIDFGNEASGNEEAQRESSGGLAARANKYYFYTSENTDDQSDHYLLRMKMSKGKQQQVKPKILELNVSKNSTKSATPPPPPPPFGCDFKLDIEMANGLTNKYVIGKYEPIDEGDHYNIIVPFLSPNFVSKYELAKLDMLDFYLDEGNSDGGGGGKEVDVGGDIVNEKLLASLGKVLPINVRVSGLSSASIKQNQLQPKKKSAAESVVGFVKYLFNAAKESVVDSEGPGRHKSDDPRCSLPIESLSVQPLRKMHRHLGAVYSSRRIARPTIRVLTNETVLETDAFSLEPDLIQAPPATGAPQAREQMAVGGSSLLYMRMALVGPHDASVGVATASGRHSMGPASGSSEEEPEEEMAEEFSKARRSLLETGQPTVARTSQTRDQPTSGPESIRNWKALAVGSGIVLVLMLIISVCLTAKPNQSCEEKCILILDAQPPAMLSLSGLPGSPGVDLGSQYI